MISRLTRIERVNFLLTNRIPRKLLTHLMGWYSQIQSPLLTRLSIRIWRIFSPDLDFSEAKKSVFNSLHDCFIRELKEGVRVIDKQKSNIVSPCDGIVGSSGMIDNGVVYQAKGFPYNVADLIPDEDLQKRLQNGCYVTLRLTSTMYHRFHAPIDCDIDKVTYISGDTWNVNPIALARIENLFCKNERAFIELKTEYKNQCLVLVPVAAILVASMRFHCLDKTLNLRYKGPNVLPCSSRYNKGDEMGYFEHGSTILVFASSQFVINEEIKQGERIKMGAPLLHNATFQ
jgi:phosphatidylserine decarboxylase